MTGSPLCRGLKIDWTAIRCEKCGSSNPRDDRGALILDDGPPRWICGDCVEAWEKDHPEEPIGKFAKAGSDN